LSVFLQCCLQVCHIAHLYIQNLLYYSLLQYCQRGIINYHISDSTCTLSCPSLWQDISCNKFQLIFFDNTTETETAINKWYVEPKQEHCLSTQNLLLVCLEWSSFNSGMYRGYEMTYWEISRTSLQESNFCPGLQRKYKKSENVCTQEYWNLHFINSFF
jgi:hypothetical protein